MKYFRKFIEAAISTNSKFDILSDDDFRDSGSAISRVKILGKIHKISTIEPFFGQIGHLRLIPFKMIEKVLTPQEIKEAVQMKILNPDPKGYQFIDRLNDQDPNRGNPFGRHK